MTGTDDHDAEDNTTNDAADEDTTGASADATGGGVLSTLRSLVETLAEAGSAEKAVGRGRTDIGRGRIGHDFSIGVGTIDDVTDADRRRIGGSGIDAGIDVGTAVGGAGEAGDTAGTTDAERPTDVQYNDEETEAIVAVDVHDIDPERLAAGVSSRNGDLLIGTDERIAERVPHRLADATLAAATYHNGVLELHLRGGGADRTGADTTGGERP